MASKRTRARDRRSGEAAQPPDLSPPLAQSPSTAGQDLASAVIGSFVRASGVRSVDVAHHNIRVGRMAKIVGEALGLSQDALAWLPDACAIHDIGKLGIPDAVLNKPGTLTAAEWAAVQAHCTIGHEILRNAKHPLLDTAAKVALSHHEHFDGSGYPRGLAGARYRWRRGSWQYATPTTPCGKIALIVRASAMTPPCG